jgi:hypothetical protein
MLKAVRFMLGESTAQTAQFDVHDAADAVVFDGVVVEISEHLPQSMAVARQCG